MNKLTNFWFRALLSPEGADGGSAPPVDTGTGEGSAGEGNDAGSAPSPAPTFLSQAAQAAKQGDDAGAGAGAGEGGEGGDGEAPSVNLTELTLPDGFVLDEETGKAFSDLLLNPDMSPQERAQAFMDLHVSALQAGIEAQSAQLRDAMVKENLELWNKTNEEWRKQLADLPEFKDNLDAEAGKVMQALVTVGAGDDFFAAMDMTGAGNNPAILQVLHRLAKPFMEGGAVTGAGGQTQKRELGANIYSSANKP